MADITSANSVFVLAVPLLEFGPLQIQGYAADDIFTAEEVEPIETMMGLDGNLSGGYMPTKKPFEFTLMADSPSNAVFDYIQAQQDALFQALQIQGSLTLPSVGSFYSLNNGFLTRYKPMPDGRKVLQPRRFRFTWESVPSSPVTLAG